jgi:hypothetical protein
VNHLAVVCRKQSRPLRTATGRAGRHSGAVRRAKRVAHIENRLFLLPSLHLHDSNHVASVRSSMYVASYYGCRSMHITLDDKGPSTRLIGASRQHLGNNYAHGPRSASGSHPSQRISATGSQLSVCRTIESWWKTIMATTLTL